MLELPEAQVLAGQLRKTVVGKTILSAEANHSPHGFAWYYGDPSGYGDLLNGKRITDAKGHGGQVEISAENMRLSFGDGVNLRYLSQGQPRPVKHQLLVEFTDGTGLVGTVQMYGGIWAFEAGARDDDMFYAVAQQKPTPLSDEFDFAYFQKLREGTEKYSVKGFLATEQRIPGVGNGVLQDILWRAKIHPKRKMATLSDAEFRTLFDTFKSVLSNMTDQGGRDTEKDLFGAPGGYLNVMSKRNASMPCPSCGGFIRRMAYMGGNVYVCERCQPLE